MLLGLLGSSFAMFAQPRTAGLVKYKQNNADGYMLYSAMNGKKTFLIDKCGKVVHSWTSTYFPGLSQAMFNDGSLLRCGTILNPNFGLGIGGAMQKFDWNGNLVWQYIISDTMQAFHHDAVPLPNGNILAIVWEKRTAAECIAKGRNPANIPAVIWSERIVEMQPIGKDSVDFVWEWSVWDHMIQDFDNTKPNYGVVKDHPELFDINRFEATDNGQDWFHLNAIDYNPKLDQIVITAHSLDEIYVIDHSTNLFQASTHKGGNSNKGGDILYRWGNPQNYGRGQAADRKLFKPHHAHWIKGGLTDSGSIMIFNNGWGRPGGNYSTVDVVTTPVDLSGNYSLSGSSAYGPTIQKIAYKAPKPADFYSQLISGAYSLPNDGLFITEGLKGKIFETDSKDSIVWTYINPITSGGLKNQGDAVINNSVFRAVFYTKDFEGIKGKTLTPTVEVEGNPYAKTLCEIAGNAVIESQNGLFVAPQPFQHTLTIGGIVADEMTIYNAAGAKVFQSRFSEKTDLSALQNGIYILQLRQGNAVYHVRIMKN